MNYETFNTRIKEATYSSSARDNVWSILNGRVHTNHYNGSGRWTRLAEFHEETKEALDKMGITYKEGNDAPRGGKIGDWLELDSAGMRKTLPVRKEIKKARMKGRAKKAVQRLLREQMDEINEEAVRRVVPERILSKTEFKNSNGTGYYLWVKTVKQNGINCFTVMTEQGLTPLSSLPEHEQIEVFKRVAEAVVKCKNA